MKAFIVAFLFLSGFPVRAQDTTIKRGFLFMKDASFPPLECVFVELELNQDSSLHSNMLLLDGKKDTGVFLRPLYLYKKDTIFELRMNKADHFLNSYKPQAATSASEEYKEDIYSRVLPVQLTFVLTALFSMDSDESKEYDTPIIFKGKPILSISRYALPEWGLLNNIEIIQLGDNR